MGNSHIDVQGAKEHNLKNISLKIPRETLTVVTGVSGSGKSSLVFDTIFQEGQRRFAESLSAYARQFLGQMDKPQVDHIEGLSPTVSIDQKSVSKSRRSTVGTITEIYDFYRVLFARLGQPFCVQCQKPVNSLTKDEIISLVFEKYHNSKSILMCPIVRHRKGEYRKELDDLRQQGYQRVRIDGDIKNLSDEINLARYEYHTIEVIIDRVVIQEKDRSRISDSIEKCLKMGNGIMTALMDNELTVFSTLLGCLSCGTVFQEIEPRLFSFNTPWGACQTCNGLGETQNFDARLVVPDENLSVLDGAFACIADYERIPFSSYGLEDLKILAKHYQIDLKKPWKKLKEKEKNILLYGSTEDIEVKFEYEGKNKNVSTHEVRHMRGVLTVLDRVYKRAPAPFFNKFIHRSVCEDCKGTRLNSNARAVLFKDLSIIDLSAKTVRESIDFFKSLELKANEVKIATGLLKEINERLLFLEKVGLHYLAIDRVASSLSGGEAQRIRLARQVGSKLSGVLYVLDEPSIGLHQRDNKMLLETLKDLRDLNNSVVVIEHDQETMEHSDYLVDIGPEAGIHGGEIIAAGTPSEVMKEKKSLTGQYLKGTKKIEVPPTRRKVIDWLTLEGASGNNLKDITVDFPLKVLCVVTGVSGSGKSTLVIETLEKILHNHIYHTADIPATFKQIKNIDKIDKVINIDQAPIGRTPRSNPVTYTKVFDLIRKLYSETTDAKVRGYKPGRFSFNVAGGRCETCSGNGEIEIEMQFLSNVRVVCDECQGKRYNEETLEIYYKGKNIFEVLELSIDEAAEFFKNYPNIANTLNTLQSVGLGYLKLGQSSTTLSGGEAQRVKLASELRKKETGNTFYILDEPTTGLHFTDIARLLDTLQELVNMGNSVLIIEHNLDVIKCADYMIDLGPDGGKGGGYVVAKGTPEEVVKIKESPTAAVLKEVLNINKKKKNIRQKKIAKNSRIQQYLEVVEAKENNLKNVSVQIPKNSFTVITGKSGSGKSSLALDTIFKEGQARYVESLSSYARQFLGKNEKAHVKEIKGLAPAIAVDQKNVTKNPRSTVATTTEIYDYFRLLFARIGHHHCPVCKKEIIPYSAEKTYQELIKNLDGQKGYFCAPLYLHQHLLHFKLLKATHINGIVEDLKKEGFLRIIIKNKVYELTDTLPNIKENDNVYLVMDRLAIGKSNKKRMIEAIEKSFELGNNIFVYFSHDLKTQNLYSRVSACHEHQFYVPTDISPRHFSFNSHWGACDACNGLGHKYGVSKKLLIIDEKKPLFDGGVQPQIASLFNREGGFYTSFIEGLFKTQKIKKQSSFQALNKKQQEALLYGTKEEIVFERVKISKNGKKSTVYEKPWEGLIPFIERLYHETDSDANRAKYQSFFKFQNCQKCQGERLNEFARNVTFGRETLYQITNKNVQNTNEFFKSVKLSKNEGIIAKQILTEIISRLDFIENVGLSYLELNRSSATLSGGESQRIRLATQLGNKLQGVIYVLDEPTIGLHAKDTQRLITTLNGLRDLGNTIIVVEHDEEVMKASDYILDMGPEAGSNGGECVFFGKPQEIFKDKKSLTGQYLSGKKNVYLQETKRNSNSFFELKGISRNNLKNIDVKIPFNCLTVITGVSGSGKSTLALDTIPDFFKEIKIQKNEFVKSFKSDLEIKQLKLIDQSPIGATPSSTPATYSGVFDFIRDVFAATKTAKIRGFKKGRFSFNSGDGRCSACEGKGATLVQMHFLADVWMTCEHCHGKRFNQETLNITFKDYHIADILLMTIEQAYEVFIDYPKIKRKLLALIDVGLGYLQLGQSSITLSGGEAQRMKLATELSKASLSSDVLYILDEPTTGQHFDDVNKLIQIFHRLVNANNTVIVVEHNLDVIKNADYLVDLGPDGGTNGGEILFQNFYDKMKNCQTPTLDFINGKRKSK